MRWMFSVGLIVILLLVPQSTVAANSEARAVIKAPERALISAQLVARVVELPRRVGDSFEAGDTLVELECDVFEAEKRKVLAERELAQLKLQNAQQLLEMDAIGRVDLGIAEAQLKQVQAELEIVEFNTNRCVIQAPYRGAVVDVHTSRYQLARQNEELLEIVSYEHLEAELVAPAEWLTWLRPEAELTLAVEELQENVHAIVTHLSPVIDPVSRTVVVRARLLSHPENLRPGMSALAVFNSAN